MKKYWENTLGQTGIIVFFITCLILLGISSFYNWLYIVSIPLTLFFIYSLNKDYSETMERVRRNEKYYEKEKSKSEEDGIDKFKGSIEIFIKKMKEIPDWYQIIQARGNGHAMMVDIGIKVDDYEYWSNAHKEEYMVKYNNGDLDVEGINLRIKNFRFIANELEKVIKKASELSLNITTEMANDYHAARASVLGAEKALKEMSPKAIDTDKNIKIEGETSIIRVNQDSELQNDFPGKKAIENYFIERPNIARIFDELNMFLYKGFSAEKYLIETGIINSDDTRRIVSQGFYDISLYLETLEKDVNTLNRRDLSISEEFKKRYGKEVPEGSGIDSILFALHPEIKTSLKQAIEMLNKDGDLKPRPSKSNKLEKEIDDLYDSMFKKIKSFDRDEDLEYWYKINLESVDNPISVNARENRGYSLEQEMLEFLWGHNEEYESKMQGYSQDDKEEFIGMRIISFGALLVFYNELIEKINSVSKRENIDLSEKINRLELEKTHCKARLYGSIKFALTSDISKNKIKEWFDEFDDNNDLYIGLNPMDY